MLTTFDFLALGTVFVCIVVSAMRGLLAELISFGGWIVALIVARMFAVPVSDVVFSTMQPRSMAVVCAFVLVYVVARIATVFVQYLLDFVVKKAKLSNVNRLLGALLGAVKGTLVVSFVVLACMFSSLPQEPEWKDALSSAFFEETARMGAPYLPDFLADQLLFEQPENTEAANPETDSSPKNKKQSNPNLKTE